MPYYLQRGLFTKYLISSLSIALAMSVCTLPQKASAKTPPQVLEPYKQYRSAVETGDTKSAYKFAEKALKAAEKHLGDHKTTGDLAQNFAVLDMGESTDDQIEAMERAMGLALVQDSRDPAIYMERGIRLAQMLGEDGNTFKPNKIAKKVITIAEDEGLTSSTFYAEALTIQAGHYAKRRSADTAVKTAEKALAVFDTATDEYVSAYPIFANLYEGFGHEINEDIFEAALSYQKVMQYTDGIDYKTHPVVGRALGRWSHMRRRLYLEDKLDEARKNGLCDCFPYNEKRNETVKPIKRVPPRFKSRVLRQGVSGYSIIRFDLTDTGETTNPEVLVSWPPDYYEETSLEALSKWEYSARTEDETDADRSNIITTIRYDIEDEFGNPVW